MKAEATNEHSSCVTDIPVVPSLILRGYWSVDKDGSNIVTEAEIYDILYYHVELPNDITDSSITLKLFKENTFSDDYLGIERTFYIDKKGYIKIDFVEILEKKKLSNSALSTWQKYADGNLKLYWRINYSKGEEKLNDNDAKLKMFSDKYVSAILGDRIRYTCNAGWIDKTHFKTTTKRNRNDIGATNLWKQLTDETGRKSEWRDGFMVTYTQDVNVKRLVGISAAIPLSSKSYMVKYGLSIETKKRIAMAIFQEVSLSFEDRQGLYFDLTDSAFEPADLISNLLGLYGVLRNEDPDTILKRCKELGCRESLKIYRRYPGTFSKNEYKNKKFTPRFFEHEECTHSPKCNNVFPKEYQEIQPYPKNDAVFRDWIDLFDVHKGVPPLSTYK